MIDAFSQDKLSLAEVADHFNLSEQTINNWRKRGLSTITIGRTVYTTRSEINNFLNNNGVKKATRGRPLHA
jgi:predicted DNA-binding protein YlxM (UPF0122 family)